MSPSIVVHVLCSRLAKINGNIQLPQDSVTLVGGLGGLVGRVASVGLGGLVGPVGLGGLVGPVGLGGLVGPVGLGGLVGLTGSVVACGPWLVVVGHTGLEPH